MSGVRGRRQHNAARTPPLPGGEIAAAAASAGGLAATTDGSAEGDTDGGSAGDEAGSSPEPVTGARRGCGGGGGGGWGERKEERGGKAGQRQRLVWSGSAAGCGAWELGSVVCRWVVLGQVRGREGVGVRVGFGSF